ncbi:MAG: hypothetical protein J07HQW2_00606 [Haloquadratum walsbyi J07HQW2]|uniref:Uncharacterized protein n=1 Tax=Haloquadratum walsbyi J07HQW2 TaxID=1238425 RepID=U1PKF8_9EURY|nr:MAG: hypothetical protein J07HQW2_00606 [Haloquadratum walsbyi J07HQW2]
MTILGSWGSRTSCCLSISCPGSETRHPCSRVDHDHDHVPPTPETIASPIEFLQHCINIPGSRGSRRLRDVPDHDHDANAIAEALSDSIAPSLIVGSRARESTSAGSESG